MSKEYKKTNHNLRLHFFMLSIIMIATLSLSVGYAAVNSVLLDISGEAKAFAQDGIFITDAVYKENNNADTVNSGVNSFFAAKLNSKVVLSPTDSTSSITYDVTIYNSTNLDYVFKNVEYGDTFYDNNGIEFVLTGLEELKTPLRAGEFLTFQITFKYKDGVIAASNKLNSILDFKFTILSNVTTETKDLKVYHLGLERSFDVNVINESNTPVSVNLSVEGNVVTDTVPLSAKETKSVSIELPENLLKSLKMAVEYPVNVNLVGEDVAAYTTILNTNAKLEIVPTISNFDLRDRKDSDRSATGTTSNPYIVHKAEDMIRLSLIVNGVGSMNGIQRERYGFTNENVILDQDIDFSNESYYYNPHNENFGDLNNTGYSEDIYSQMNTGTGYGGIGRAETPGDDSTAKWFFEGIFDGNNHTIYNLFINPDIEIKREGLFAYISNATIKNLNVTGTYNVKGDAGGIVGCALGECNIINCKSYANISNTTGFYSLGGILGALWNNASITIQDCINYGNITSNAAAAGLIGIILRDATVVVDQCSNEGTITSTYTEVYGGNDTFIVGTAGLLVKDVNNSGSVIITNSNNKGTVIGKKRVAGIVSLFLGPLTIENSYNAGNVTGETYVAGILAEQYSGSSTLNNVYNVGTITSSGGVATNDIGSSPYYCGQIVGNRKSGTLTMNVVASPVSVAELSSIDDNSNESSTQSPENESSMVEANSGVMTASMMYDDSNNDNIATFMSAYTNEGVSTDTTNVELQDGYNLMKTDEFLNILGEAFKVDTTGKNGGYPILVWE